MSLKTQIIYVPGMKPKPPVHDHEEALWRCMLNGVERADPAVAADLAQHRDAFSVIPWSSLFYQETADIEPDRSGLEKLLASSGPAEEDIREARHWHKRLGRLAYLLSDAFPALIDWVANPNLKSTLQDTQRYFRNHAGVATAIRRLVAERLREVCASDTRVLLIAHSLGSVISFDVLWQLTHREHSDVSIDQFLTIGSPLGLNFMRHRMLNAKSTGKRRYPHNIQRWVNLSAVGEMTALDRTFADDYREMLELGLIDTIEDQINLQTYFRGPQGLNVHKCYGYMANEKTGAVIADWYRRT